MGRENAGSQYPFPAIPAHWSPEGRQFALGLRRVFDILFNTDSTLKKAYPVGTVVLTVNNTAPFSFGTWESVSTGITGVAGWKRTR